MTDIRLQTAVQLPEPNFAFEPDSGFCCIGSCFADHLAEFFIQSKFSLDHNPAGITYNPVSISKTLDAALKNRIHSTIDLVEQDELFHSLDHHGSFSDPHPENVITKIHQRQSAFRDMLMKADGLILTLGTAHVFRLNANSQIVNNCHKLSNHLFSRERLEVSRIADDLSNSFVKIWKANPKLQIILTVSPVRHIRDGLIENQRSKAALLLAASELELRHSQITYFPSYEITMDELRDYRFYNEDLVHPTPLAVRHIIHRFITLYFNTEGQDFIRQMTSINKSINHRPLHPNRSSHLKFLGKLLSDIENLQKRYPGKDFSAERALVNRQLEKN